MPDIHHQGSNTNSIQHKQVSSFAVLYFCKQQGSSSLLVKHIFQEHDPSLRPSEPIFIALVRLTPTFQPDGRQLQICLTSPCTEGKKIKPMQLWHWTVVNKHQQQASI